MKDDIAAAEVALKWPSFPYPGLRPFRMQADADESLIFYGRDSHKDDVLERLNTSQFVSVVGPSGCGKSSLVKVGVIPALEAGFLTSAGYDWVTIEMRPGRTPLGNLAKAFSGLGDPANPTAVMTIDEIADLLTHERSALWVLMDHFAPVLSRGSSPRRPRCVLLLLDQFEEIFSGAQDNIAVDQFVGLLTQFFRRPHPQLYVMLTMRTDFIGQCANFPGLAEILNKTQYITPVLRGQDLSDAIVRPAEAYGGEVEPELVAEIMRDMGTGSSYDADHLPLMQHAMLWLWQQALARTTGTEPLNPGLAPPPTSEKMVLTRKDYEEHGRLRDILNFHAETIFERMKSEGDREQRVRLAETVFRRLSERDASMRYKRAPALESEVCQLADCSLDELNSVIGPFKGIDASFVEARSDTHPDDQLLDLSHESLIRQWQRLRAWTDAEADKVAMFRKLADEAEAWAQQARSQAFLKTGGQLRVLQDWWAYNRPTPVWASRYNTIEGEPGKLSANVPLVEEFRTESTRAETRAARIVRRRKLLLYGAVGLFLALLGIVIVLRAQYERQEAIAAKQGQARLVTMLGMEALRLVSPNVALLVAMHGLEEFGLGENASDGADVPELYMLAYAALQQLRERQIIHVANSFLSLAFDKDGNLLTFFNQSLHRLDHAAILHPSKDEHNPAVAIIGLRSGALTVDPTADGTVVLVSGGLQTFVIDLQHPDNTQELTTPASMPGSRSASVGIGAISRDGNLVVTTKRDGPSRLWRREQDPDTGRTSYPLAQDFGKGSEGTAVAISSTKQFLAIADIAGTIMIYQIDDQTNSYRKLDSSVEPVTGALAPSQANQQITMLSFEPSAHPELLLVAYQGRSPRLYRWRNSKWIDLRGGDRAFRAAFSPDGGLIAAASMVSKTVDVWRTTPILKAEKPDLDPWLRLSSGETFFQVAFDRQDRLAAASLNGTVWLWDLQGPALAADLPDAAAKPPEQREASLSRNGTIFTSDLVKRQFTISSNHPRVIQGPIKTPLDPGWNPAPLNQGTAQPNKVARADDQWTLKGSDVSPDGMWLVLTPDKGQILLYDLRRSDHQPIAAFGRSGTEWGEAAFFAEAATRVVAKLRDGNMIAWQYFDSAQKLKDFSDGKLPVQIDFTTPSTSYCKVELTTEAQQELDGHFWPALVRDMSGVSMNAPPCGVVSGQNPG